MQVFQVSEVCDGPDPVGCEVQGGQQAELGHVFDDFDLIILQEEAAEVGEVVEVLNLADTVVLQPQRLEPRVLAQVLDLAEALVVEVEDVIERGGHVQIVFTAMILKHFISLIINLTLFYRI